MKATEQYFPVVLCIMLYNVLLTFTSQDEIVKCDRIQMKPTGQYFPVVLFIMLHKVVLTFTSMDEISSTAVSFVSRTESRVWEEGKRKRGGGGGGLGTLPIVPEQPRLFNFLILSLSVSLFSRRFSPLKEPLRRKEVLYAYTFNSIKSVSMGLTVSRQTATSSTVKKWEILPSTVKEAVAISRQRVLLFQISVQFSCSSRTAGSWRIFLTGTTGFHVPKYTHFSVLHSFVSKLTLPLTSFWKYFQFQNISD